MTSDLDELLDRLRAAARRLSDGTSQREAARRLGLPGDRYLRDFLAGRNCRLRTLLTIARGLDRLASGRTAP